MVNTFEYLTGISIKMRGDRKLENNAVPGMAWAAW